MNNTSNDKEKKYWLDRPKNVWILLTDFYILLVILIIIDMNTRTHPHFPWEGWPGFYAVFGFVSFVAIVLLAKYILRKIVKRDEDYYDDEH